jgi:hypothetical protein
VGNEEAGAGEEVLGRHGRLLGWDLEAVGGRKKRGEGSGRPAGEGRSTGGAGANPSRPSGTEGQIVATGIFPLLCVCADY